MGLFHKVEDAVAVVRSGGVYRQVDVYTRECLTREHRVFIKYGGGYVGLRNYDNGTTLPKVFWEEIQGVDYIFNTLGIMCRKNDPSNVDTTDDIARWRKERNLV